MSNFIEYGVKSMRKEKMLTISALVIALYIVIMYLTQNFSFGQYQIRIATGLYALVYHFPFLIFPIAIANLLSNLLLGGLGLYDVIGGFIVGLLSTSLILLLKKNKLPSLICCLPIGIIPSIIVPLWLSFLLGIPYIVLLTTLFIGQMISAFTLGLFIIKSKAIAQICINQYQ